MAVVRIDRPKVNALSSQVLGELEAVMGALTAQLPGALVIWGGERIFSAGADVGEIAAAAGNGGLLASFRRALDAVSSFPRASIAALEGYALGGGLELALSCDLRVASASARLGQPEILLGLIPGAGGTQRLARLVGPARAKDLVFTGRQLDAEEAYRWGLVDRVAEAGALDAALALATELAGGALAAQVLGKRAIDRGLELPLAAGLDLERDLFLQALATRDGRAGVEAFVREGPGRVRFSGD